MSPNLLAATDWAMWAVVIAVIAIIVGAIVGLPAWLTWRDGRDDRRDAKAARAKRALDKAAAAAAALQAGLRPEPRPHNAHTSRKLRIHNEGQHGATVTYFRIWNGDENGPSVSSGGALTPPIGIEPGEHHDFLVDGPAAGRTACRERWTDGRPGEQDQVWDIDLPETRFETSPRSPLRPR